MKDYWDSDDSKLLSVTAINGFIIALTRQLGVNGIRDFEFYNEIFGKWSFDFSIANFPYASSQYRKFSNQILSGAFGISESKLKTI